MLVTCVVVAIGAIGVSTLLGVALARAAARGDAELEDRYMHTLAMRERTITVGRITSSRQIYEGLALRPQAPLAGTHTGRQQPVVPRGRPSAHS